MNLVPAMGTEPTFLLRIHMVPSEFAGGWNFDRGENVGPDCGQTGFHFLAHTKLKSQFPGAASLIRATTYSSKNFFSGCQ